MCIRDAAYGSKPSTRFQSAFMMQHMGVNRQHNFNRQRVFNVHVRSRIRRQIVNLLSTHTQPCYHSESQRPYRQQSAKFSRFKFGFRFLWLTAHVTYQQLLRNHSASRDRHPYHPPPLFIPKSNPGSENCRA